MNVQSATVVFCRRHQSHKSGLQSVGRNGLAAFVQITGLAVLLFLAARTQLTAANLPVGFSETVVPGPGGGGSWNGAVGVTFNEAGRMFVWEIAGRVYFKDPADAGFTLLLDISEEVGAWTDHGLAGFALDPHFEANGNIYLLYAVDRHHLLHFGTTNYNPNANEYAAATIGRLTRYTCTSSNDFRSVNPASRFVLIGESKTNGIPIFSNTHGVGSLVFGQDHTLLVSCGDGASPFVVDIGGTSSGSYVAQGLADGMIRTNENVGAYRSQLVDCLGGKILRIDPVTGDGVPSNPYYDGANPRAAKSRVWSVGARNPFRMSLRPDSGDHDPAEGKPGVLYIGNVGWNNWESLKVVTGPAQNLGWPLFEGLELTPLADGETYNTDVLNRDATNSECGGYFTFRQLLKQDTTNAVDQPPFDNPCNPSVKIPASIPQFLHTRPVLDWNHFTAITRTGTYNGSGQATTADVGAGGSPVTGDEFFGSCAVGGTWFTANTFPTQYVNTYFMADWSAGIIKNIAFTTNNAPVDVRDFASAAGSVVCLAAHPGDGSLYYVSYDVGDAGVVRKIAYTGNRTPVAVTTSDKTFGPGPLTVQFTGSGSSDPDAQTLTYSWNFGDGSALSTAANPSHTFTPPNTNAAPYIVTLTVTDTGGLFASTTMLVVANDTPPEVAINSPVHGALYSMISNTPFNLTATVSDAETPNGQLAYNWQTFLHHNSHEHLVDSTTNQSGSTVVGPDGCDDVNVLYYRIALTVTDPAGLSTTREVGVFPDCGATDTPPTISDIGNQSTAIGAVTADIPFSVGDTQVVAGNLQLSAGSSNLTLVPLNRISFGGSGSNRTITITPVAGIGGTSLITVNVNDGPNTVSDSFLLTVTGTNSAPTITAPANQATTIETQTPPNPFIVGDANTPAANLTLSGFAADTNLVPVANIAFGGGASNRNVTVVPAPGESGVTLITVVVSDGELSSSNSFTLTVSGTNSLPSITAPTNQTTTIGTPASANPFIIADANTPLGSLALSGFAADTNLLPAANIAFGGGGSNRTVTATPAPGQSGSTLVTIVVTDGQWSASNSYTLTVSGVAVSGTTSFTNDAVIAIPDVGTATPYPSTINVAGLSGTISNITVTLRSLNQTWASDVDVLLVGPTGATTVLMSDCGDGTATGVTLILSDEAGEALPASGLVSGTFRPTDLATSPADNYPAPAPAGPYGSMLTNFNGTAPNGTWSLYVIDDGPGDQGEFADGWSLTITTVALSNTAPAISATSNQVTFINLPTTAIPFTISDIETAASSLVLTATSSDTNLVAMNGIVFGGSGGSRTVTLTPTSNQLGSVTITLTVDDGLLSSSNSFLLTMNPVPPSTISSATFITPGELQLDGAGSANVTYTVQKSADLLTWLPVGTTTANGAGAFVFVDSTAGSAPVRFYRLVYP